MLFFIIYWYWLQVVKCILSLHWPTMLLLQRKSLTSQILLACAQGNKTRWFLRWGKRKRTLDRVQYCLQIGCQAVRLSYECYFTSYVPLLCAVPLSFSLLLKSYSPFFSRLACYFFFFSLMFGIVISLLWACISSFPFFDMHFCTLVMLPSYHHIILNKTL